jgi:hypothetical protein
MISFIYIYENKNKKSGVAQPLPLGHMGMVETTPILLGGGLATPVAQRGGSATPNGQREKKKKKKLGVGPWGWPGLKVAEPPQTAKT